MATVQELSDPYANFLRPLPAPSLEGVCRRCLTFTEGGFPYCYACGHQPNAISAFVAVSFSTHMGQLHTALRGYKSAWSSAERQRLELAAVLWRFLAHHERCLAKAAGVDSFSIATTVPSGSAERDAVHPLPDIVGRLVLPTAGRYSRLLRRSDVDVPLRTVSEAKYIAEDSLGGDAVLLIDDTWTSGASAQSAALSLQNAGARAVAVLVIGRHIRPEYGGNEKRLKGLPRFDWAECAHCTPSQ